MYFVASMSSILIRQRSYIVFCVCSGADLMVVSLGNVKLVNVHTISSINFLVSLYEKFFSLYVCVFRNKAV